MSIDSCYEGVIAKLTKQNKILDISNKLLSLTSNDERVLYVYSVIDDLKSFPKLIAVKKSQNVSVHYRNLGNQCFQKSEDFMAWQYYNLALLHAPLKSECYALGLSNRSAVFFSMKKYKESMEDIKKATSIKCPSKIKEKLIRRHSACRLALVNMNNDEDDMIKMNKVPNSKIENIFCLNTRDSEYLCASTKLEVVHTEEMGRHVVAKEDIRVGELLAEEDPYLILLLKSQYLFCCSYCLSRNLNLSPCDKCCFALYCSKECKEHAWREYHRVECNLMPTLVYMEFTKLELLALRTAIKARTDHESWSSLFETINLAEENENSPLRGHVKLNDKWVFDSKYYTSIHTLASNIKKRSVSDIFQKSVTAAVFLNFLEHATDFLNSNDDEKNDIKRCVAGMLLLHGMTSPTNMHGISSNVETKEGNFVNEISIASAPYAFHSLLNHSCCPNVVRFSKLGTGNMALFALRPIKKGMQLFDNYGSHHALENRECRHASLKFQYKFICACEACVNDWPTYLCLRPGALPTDVRLRKERLVDPAAVEKLQKGDMDTAYELFQPLCELIEVLEPYAPCVELADCQEALKQCLIIFKGLVPYGYSQIVEWEAIPPKL